MNCAETLLEPTISFISKYGHAYLKESSQLPIELLVVVSINFPFQNMHCGTLKEPSKFPIKKGCGYLKEPSQFPIKTKVVVTKRNRLSFLSK